MQYYIFSTCGTSILTDAARKKDDNGKLQKIIINNSNVHNFNDMDDEAQKALKDLVEQQLDVFGSYDAETACKNSAELNCLINWIRKNSIKASDCFCYLIHTDTELGSWTAQIVKDWLDQNGFMGAECKSVDHLNTSTLLDFEVGLSELAKWTFETVPQEPSNDVKYIFNVAGGFKSMSGFMQVLGQFLADETIYTFEGKKSEILSMPKLPVRWEDVNSIREKFDDYHRVSLEIKPKSPENLNSLWIRDGMFTPWGQIAWENAKRIIYSEKIQNFVCDKVKEGVKFRETVKDLDPFRCKIVNERLDDLCSFFLSGKMKNIRRLDYKLVKGNHPWSNECDAWADGAAKRLFCNEVGDGSVIVECLGSALH